MSDLLQKALQSLPHGPEFRFVDRLLSLEPGKHGMGEYLVRGDELYLRGHFPGAPLMPGVLLVEAGAQLAGIVAQSDPAIAPLAQLRLTALRVVKILGSVQPGDRMVLEAGISGRLGNLIQAKATASIGKVVIMSAELTLSGAAQPCQAMAGHLAQAT